MRYFPNMKAIPGNGFDHEVVIEMPHKPCEVVAIVRAGEGRLELARLFAEAPKLAVTLMEIRGALRMEDYQLARELVADAMGMIGE